MKIYVQAEVTESSRTFTVEPEDMNLTDEEWLKLSHQERTDKLQDFLDEKSEQPSWVVDKF